MTFKKGTRVKVIDEKLAQGFSAMVTNGDLGIIMGNPDKDGFCPVRIDGNATLPWWIPKAALEVKPNDSK